MVRMGGAMCGSCDFASEISSMSKNRAPGMWDASYSARAFRCMSGRYHEASSTRRSGSFRCPASQSVETSVFGSSTIPIAPSKKTVPW